MGHQITPVHLIYLPGLGDGYDGVRRLALTMWRKLGLRVTFIPLRWNDTNETYQAKRARIEAIVDSSRHGEKTVLVGESAGGAIALAAGLNDGRIDQVITLCGKNRGAERLARSIDKLHPAFRDAVKDADMQLAHSSVAERRKVVTFYSERDMVVAKRDTLIPDAKAVRVRIPGHQVVIMAILFVIKRRVLRLL